MTADQVRPGRVAVALTAYLAVSVSVWTADLLHHELLGLIGRVLAMPALLWLWRRIRPARRGGKPLPPPVALCLRFVSLAVFFSWLGDLSSFSLLVKLCFFLVAHTCYLLAMGWWVRRAVGRAVTRRPRRSPGRRVAARAGNLRVGLGPAAAARLLLIAVAAVLLTLASTTAGRLGPAVLAYGLVLVAMALSATTVNASVGLGAVLFVCSDTLIALNAFVLPGGLGPADALIMLTYLPAQLLIVLGLGWAVRHDRLHSPPGR